jgi:hypothetical protein
MKFSQLQHPICLYDGQLNHLNRQKNRVLFFGLSQEDDYLNIHNPISEIPDNSVTLFQSEDKVHYTKKSNFVTFFNEVYRILEPGGLCRLSIPDYRCDVLKNRVHRDDFGNISYDKCAGGVFDEDNNKMIGGVLWFPTYEVIKELLDETDFEILDFIHYYKDDNEFIMNPIEYDLGYVQRTPDHDHRVQNPKRPMSIVIDCYKHSD